MTGHAAVGAKAARNQRNGRSAEVDPATQDGSSRREEDDRPFGGYGVVLGTYGALAGALILGLRSKRRRVRPLSAMDLVLLSLAVEHVSRLITKDSVTSGLRAPFTAFKEPAGESEVNEEVVGTGLRHAVGELLTCPFCAAQWVATAFVAGRIAAPQLTTAAVSVCAAARMSDYLQLAYGILRDQRCPLGITWLRQAGGRP
jgi:hypothetical protein